MKNLRGVAIGISVLLMGLGNGCTEDSDAPKTTAKAPEAVQAGTQPAASREGGTANLDAAGIKTGIVGSWKSVDDGEVMEFRNDGSAHVKDPNAVFVATYTLPEDGTLHLAVPIFGKKGDFVYKLDLQGDEMTLTVKDRTPRKYERVK